MSCFLCRRQLWLVLIAAILLCISVSLYCCGLITAEAGDHWTVSRPDAAIGQQTDHQASLAALI